MNFEDLATTKKGRIGEQIVAAEFTKNGYVVYHAPPNTSEHFDMYAFGLKECYLVECKVVCRLAVQPVVSIDLNDLPRYIHAEQVANKPLLIYWVDVFEQCIYASSLTNFRSVYTPNKRQAKAQIHLKYTKFIRWLTLEECRKVGNPTDRYEGVTRWFNDIMALTQKRL